MLDKFSTEKKKQYMFTGAVVLGSSALIFMLQSVFSADKPKINTIETPNVKIVDKKDLDNKVFRHDAAQNDAARNAELADIKKQLEQLKNGGGQINNQQNGFGSGMPSIPLPVANQSQPITTPPPAPAPLPPSGVSPSKAPESAKKEIPRSIVMSDMIGSVTSSGGDTANNSAASESAQKVKPKSKKIEIPSGTFMQGVLLSGIDAPTGTKGKSSPQPVLIQITDMAKLPNGFGANLKECRAVGSAYGDLSSERAFVRIEKITCMTKDGHAIEKSKGQSIGYAAGEDGKVGLLGRVVTKQGTILARALMTGFVDGVAKGFQQSSMNYSVQPAGTVGVPDPNMLAQQGIGSGVSEASKKLADFYMKLANEMFPIVEINAGRKIDIVLLEKLSFDSEEDSK